MLLPPTLNIPAVLSWSLSTHGSLRLHGAESDHRRIKFIVEAPTPPHTQQRLNPQVGPTNYILVPQQQD